MKSAFVAKLAKGKRVGFSYESAREQFAAYFYDKTYTVPHGLHAVEKIRQLFAKIFNYPVPSSAPDYGLNCEDSLSYGDNTIIFLHGTTWTTKHWPESYWQQLASLVGNNGYQVLLPWGNAQEKARAERIVNFCIENKSAYLPQILPKLTLLQITSLIAKAKGIVAVDTGLGHIAAAKARPTISLFGPTDPSLTGAYGPSQTHLKSSMGCSPCLGRECAKGQNFDINPPCFTELSPEVVWKTLTEKME
jgi:heptosyltransferase-1